MIVQCEKCRTQFKVPDHKISSQGVKVRCASCQHAFRVHPSADAREARSSPGAEFPQHPVAPSSSAPSGGQFAPTPGVPAPAPFDDLAFGDDPFAAPAPPASAPAPGLLGEVPENTEALFGDLGEPASEIDFQEGPSGQSDRSLFDMPAPPPVSNVPRVENLGALPREEAGGTPRAGGGRPAGPSEAALKARMALAAAASQPPETAAPEASAGVPGGPRSLWVELIVSFGVILFLVLATATLVARGSVQAPDHASGSDSGASGLLSSLLSGVSAPPRALSVREVSNGLYETRGGRPVFYVRGQVVNQGTNPGAATVRAEILEGGVLVRSAESRAGIAPTPEELYNVSTGADLEALKAKLAAASRPIPPGGTADFLVPFDEYPTDPSRFRLRIVVGTH